MAKKEVKKSIALNPSINAKLIAALMTSNMGKLILESYLTGAGLEGKNFTLKAEFFLEETDNE